MRGSLSALKQLEMTVLHQMLPLQFSYGYWQQEQTRLQQRMLSQSPLLQLIPDLLQYLWKLLQSYPYYPTEALLHRK